MHLIRLSYINNYMTTIILGNIYLFKVNNKKTKAKNMFTVNKKDTKTM